MKNTKTAIFILSALMVTTSVLSAENAGDPSLIQEQCKSSSEITTLRDFTNSSERWLDSTILIGRDLGGTKISVNIHNQSLNYGQFLTQLNINGFTAYKSNDYIQVIDLRGIRSAPIPVVEQGKSYFDDEYVTDYIKTEKACARTMLITTRPLVPQYSSLAAHQNAHMLVVVDTYKNVQRLKLIINAIEKNIATPEVCSDNE
ncbi:MAG: hypothetical protein V4732_22120 [Pseudomonadota bacterium]